MALVPMTIQEQLALRLPAQRKHLHLSQAQLAKQVGTSQAAIARIEAGQGNPTADLMQRIITALDFDVTIFIRPTSSEASSA